MTTDERLDRLTERHEALAQTVELITANIDKLTADVDKLTTLMGQTAQFINRLAHIAEAHEQRIDRLEGHQ
jgi:hypothetical protein